VDAPTTKFSTWRERVAAARVLVMGDVMLDRYWFGDVERISPEAPVPVAKITRMEERPGGAANVARNVAALGASATLLSVTGDDEAGLALERLLAGERIRTSFLRDASLFLRLILLRCLLVCGDACGRGLVYRAVHSGRVLRRRLRTDRSAGGRHERSRDLVRRGRPSTQ